MDLELLGSPGWREALIAVIALLVGYIIVIFLRMRRLQRELRSATVPPRDARAALAVYTASEQPVAEAPAPPAASPADPEQSVNPDVAAASVAVDELPPPGDADELEFAWNEPPPEIPGQALIDALQADIYQLRTELDELRNELLTAREDFRRQLTQVSESPQAASPLYNDAMQMAAQGQDAGTIAQHCGIARAEADLVVALVRNRNEGT